MGYIRVNYYWDWYNIKTTLKIYNIFVVVIINAWYDAFAEKIQYYF